MPSNPVEFLGLFARFNLRKLLHQGTQVWWQLSGGIGFRAPGVSVGIGTDRY